MLLQRKFRIHQVSFPKGLLYATIAFGFVGPAVLVYPLGGFSLFPYRVALMALMVLLLLQYLQLGGRLGLKAIPVKLYLQFYLLWLAYACLSLLWAVSLGDAARHITFLLMGTALIFFMVYYCSDLTSVHWVHHLWLLATLAFLFIGLWEIRTGLHLPNSNLYRETRVYLLHAPTAVFYNKNDFATFLSFSFAFFLTFCKYAGKKPLQALALCGLALLCYVLFKTGSRANFIAVALQLGLFLMFLNRKARARLLLLSPLLLLAFFYLFPQFLQSLNHIAERMASVYLEVFSETGSSSSLRLNLLRNALHHALDTWGFGVGAGNAEYYMAHRSIYEVSFITNVHNWWFEILMCYGFLILFGYLFLYARLFYVTFRFYRRSADPLERKLCETSLLVLLGFIVASNGPSSLMPMSFQWIFFGYSISLVNVMFIRAKERSRHEGPHHLQPLPQKL